MILAGDIGGTKTVLALYTKKKGVRGGAIHETRFENHRYRSLKDILFEFFRQTKRKPEMATLGVAGPVRSGRAQITNLAWSISAEEIQDTFEIPKVHLLNDLQAIAVAVPHLKGDDLFTLNEGIPKPHGNIAVIAPGTGLGISFLVWTGKQYIACASEGGHTAFSPRDHQEMELLAFLQRRHGHVSFERICAGGQLANIYDFFIEKGIYKEPKWLREELSRTKDRTPVIVQTALGNKADISKATLDMFVHILGTVTGNMAVTLLSTGGIYLGGGIPPRIVKRLQQPDFLSAIGDKGRFSALCANMPVRVIRNPNAALFGAAWYGLTPTTICARE